ncbi:transposase [Kitasatospora sp. NPDC086791]|uniref:RNA-guided endonuclease InsQ/TnpB family protein n=1 Tax=Kitasatospora sp. NPDC086791 TaxID=3155178 RepID=UPI00341B17CC
MTISTPVEAVTGHARYTYRLRVSSTALAALGQEWGRARWVWNECVHMSRTVHRWNQANPEQEPRTCGPAQLDRLLTEARGAMTWLREGASVPQQQIIRDFAKSRAKALKDIIDWGVRETATTTSDAHDLPHPEHGRKARDVLTRYDRMAARRKPPKGKPGSKGYRHAKKLRAKAYRKVADQRRDTARKWAKQVVRDHDALAVEDFRPTFLARTTMARKAADAAIGATKRALIEMGRKHHRAVHLVDPRHTTMDCAHCGARAKHRLPLSERTYTRTACGAVSSRDKNSARVMLVRAGLVPG